MMKLSVVKGVSPAYIIGTYPLGLNRAMNCQMMIEDSALFWIVFTPT